MVNRDVLIKYINAYLKSETIADSSLNGLQVEGADAVKKIAFGVSANMEFFKAATQAGADTLIVHHGLLWSQNPRVTGQFKSRIEFLIKNDLNLCAWHLPLDIHPEVGNNAQMVKLLGLKKVVLFGAYHGVNIGFKGVLPKALTLRQIELKLGYEANTLYTFGKKKVSSVGVVSGGSCSMFDQAIDAGLDLYVSGNKEEFVQEMAREGKINYMAIGHYNSETYGVKALMKHIANKFGVKTEFIDIPNPL